MPYICPEPLDVCPCKTHRVKRCTKTGAKCKKKPSDSAPKKNNDADKPAKQAKRAKATKSSSSTCDHLLELYSQLEILDKERIRILRQILVIEKTLPSMPKANEAKKADDTEKKAKKKARKAKKVESESESSESDSDSDSDSSDDD